MRSCRLERLVVNGLYYIGDGKYRCTSWKNACTYYMMIWVLGVVCGGQEWRRPAAALLDAGRVVAPVDLRPVNQTKKTPSRHPTLDQICP
eukprot:COSAG06_NODE_2547_length_6695_cov_5.498636_4_plen_90_part_00